MKEVLKEMKRLAAKLAVCAICGAAFMAGAVACGLLVDKADAAMERSLENAQQFADCQVYDEMNGEGP